MALGRVGRYRQIDLALSRDIIDRNAIGRIQLHAVAGEGEAAVAECDAVENGAGREVVVGGCLRGAGKHQTIASYWREVIRPVGRSHPVVVRAAAVPGPRVADRVRLL